MPTLLYSETLPGGASWSARLRRGQGLRLVDASGTANVALSLLRADDPTERFNLPDTLKSQHIARLTYPYVMQSDMGHVMASITEDTSGWHDVLGGLSDAISVATQYGEATYQTHRNARHTNAREHFLVELGKYGLTERDLPSAVNFFSRVSVKEGGSLAWEPQGKPSQSVTLRFEMDMLVVVSATPHPLDPSTAWTPAGVELEVLRMNPPRPDDPSRTVCDQNARAFTLTERLFL
jgi:uncharacterized protein